MSRTLCSSPKGRRLIRQEGPLTDPPQSWGRVDQPCSWGRVDRPGMRMDGVGNVEGIQAAEKYELSRWKISIGFLWWELAGCLSWSQGT